MNQNHSKTHANDKVKGMQGQRRAQENPGRKGTDEDAKTRMTDEGDSQNPDTVRGPQGGQGPGQGRGMNPGEQHPEKLSVGLPMKKSNNPARTEARSKRADAGLAAGQDDVDEADGTKTGSGHRNPPVTRPQGKPHEKRNTM